MNASEHELLGAADSGSRNPLRVRAIEILWHCNERNEEAEQLGMQSSAVEGITSIDYCQARNRLVTTGGDGCIRMWQLHSSALASWLENSASAMSECSIPVCTMKSTWMPLAARWSPHGGMVASAHCDGKVCLWWRDRSTSDPEEWKDYRHLTGHMSDVYDMCFSPDSRYLFSGAGDGSIVIHDLEGSAMPVVQLTGQHSKFCRGVAWDPWNTYLSSFGAGPSLLCYQNVPPRKEGGRMQLVGQRKCQGDFLSESCTLSFRRMSWSPDGLFLAVPYGKLARRNNNKLGENASTSDIFDVIEAREKEAQSSGAQPERRSNQLEEEEVQNGDNDHAADDMMHCVNIYTRGSLDKLAARLGMRGYNEVRGVQWAPCFLEPVGSVEQSPLVIPPEAQSNLEGAAPCGTVDSRPSAGHTYAPPSAKDAASRESWGPSGYRMALAVWTSDAVLVYTTDSSARHSDFTDLHMRSITDVAWSANAEYLYTASLDGYVSVIAFGTSLSMAHRLPTFCSSPITQSICGLLRKVNSLGSTLEASRRSRAEQEQANKAASGGSSGVAVAVVRKKKRTEAPVAATSEISVDNLAALIG